MGQSSVLAGVGAGTSSAFLLGALGPEGRRAWPVAVGRLSPPVRWSETPVTQQRLSLLKTGSRARERGAGADALGAGP